MRTSLLLLVGVLAMASTACSHVAPYQRGKLAHYTMTDDQSGVPPHEHLYGVQEGAVGGGGGGGGGGCGCN